MRSPLIALVALGVSAGCAKVKPPDFSPTPTSQEFRCERERPRDIVIPIELYKQSSGGRDVCLARVNLDPGATPRGCRGRGVWWRVTNNCDSKASVQIAFSPFDVNSTRQDVKPFRQPGDYGYITDRIWSRARGTKAGDPGKCSDSTDDVCGSPYKYDVYVNGVLVLDPELEVEY